jgi:hypothetical protein
MIPGELDTGATGGAVSGACSQAHKSAGKAEAVEDEGHRFTFSESGRVPLLPPDEIERLGVKIAVYPLTLMMAAAAAMRKAATELIRARTNRHLVSEYVGWDSVNRLTGLPEVQAFEARHQRAGAGGEGAGGSGSDQEAGDQDRLRRPALEDRRAGREPYR